MIRSLCFVLMPFGKETDGTGRIIDFDAVYSDIISPAIKESGLTPLRADEEVAGEIIHNPMFERLILCEYAVADLTTANANVFYELGVRHAVRPSTTVLLFSKGTSQLPFDVSPLQVLPYELTSDGKPCNGDDDKNKLKKRLEEAQVSSTKYSPIYQLLDDYPDIGHTKTDVFRERVEYSDEIKKQLSEARKKGVEEIRAIEKTFGNIASSESGPVIDLFLSYRGVKAWKDMIRIVQKMPPPLANTVMVQEQLAFALNRDGQPEQAEKILISLIEKRGGSSETYSLLGRVYKDKWESLYKNGEEFAAKSSLTKAIDAYLKGFEADFRDAYPGINAVTLMEINDPPDPRRKDIIPVVRYAVQRKIDTGNPDYWDYATLLELAVLGKDEEKAMEALGNCLISIREVWEPETTLRNLELIDGAEKKRNEDLPWMKTIMDELQKKL